MQYLFRSLYLMAGGCRHYFFIGELQNTWWLLNSLLGLGVIRARAHWHKHERYLTGVGQNLL